MILKLKEFFHYLFSLGLLRGLFLYIQLEILKWNKFRIKNNDNFIYYRPGTSDLKVFHEVFLDKSYALPLENIRTIIDGGANIGFTSLYFIDICPGAKIYAIEPEINNYKLLIKNTERYMDIIPILGGLWNRDVDLIIKDSSESPWAFEVCECPSYAEGAVPGISIDSLMKEQGLSMIDLLKLDVEGSEKEIFTDNFDNWIRSTRNIILEIHDWRKMDCSKTVFRTISGYNFSTRIINGMLWFENEDLK